MDCSPPGSSVHGIFQARVLEWGGAINPVYKTAKETLMYRTVFGSVGEGEGGMIWENVIETCVISYMK